MDEERPMPEEQEAIRYAEEADREVVRLRAAVADLADLIDGLDATGGFAELEAGLGGDGPVVRLCRMISKPLPPRLKAWLERTGTE
jgi:hypothetical protein